MIVYQNFEWDFREAAANLATYGVTFKEASTVFGAENVALSEDLDSDQVFASGTSARGRVLVVAHRRGARIRILGAMVQAKIQAKIAVEDVTTETAASADTGAPDEAALPKPAAEPPKPAAEPSSPAAEPPALAAKPPKPAAESPKPPAKPPALAAKPAKPAAEPPALAAEPPALAAESPAPATEPAPVTTAAVSTSRIPGAGMSAEEYGIYWDAYAAARDAAKLEGKSLHVAQRIGREAGELAVARQAPAPKATKPSAKTSPQARTRTSASWRAAARTTNVDG